MLNVPITILIRLRKFCPRCVGYVNEANAVSEGNLFASGDDDFLVSLMAGDKIMLTIAQNGADLDMELYDSSRVLVDDSLGTGNTETWRARRR